MLLQSYPRLHLVLNNYLGRTDYKKIFQLCYLNNTQQLFCHTKTNIKPGFCSNIARPQVTYCIS